MSDDDIFDPMQDEEEEDIEEEEPEEKEEKEPKMVTKEKDETHPTILEELQKYFEDNPRKGISIKDLSEKFRKSKYFIVRDLKKLLANDIVNSIGNRKYKVFFLKGTNYIPSKKSAKIRKKHTKSKHEYKRSMPEPSIEKPVETPKVEEKPKEEYWLVKRCGYLDWILELTKDEALTTLENAAKERGLK
jgi:hypothetical protein